ncbi:MAG: ankyrin repeat domain-containing protein [Candidatus Micrarchaeota archaeon]|nr:ankyrin repeat domain-containing protein [Candidatus Micrarchaeota archaeon]
MGLFRGLRGLATGALADAKMHNANVKLWKAIKKNDPYMMSDAINAGAEIEAKSNLGETPLMGSARVSPELVNILLERGAEPDRINGNGRTALMIALEATNMILMHQRIEVLRILLAAGASQDIVDGYGQSARDQALTKEVRDVLDEFSGLTELRRSQSLAVEKKEGVDEIVRGLSEDVQDD